MKSFIYQLVLFATLLGCLKLAEAKEDETAIMKRVTEHCIKETGATADQANRIVSDHLVKIEPKDFTENMKCFLLCFYKQIKILTADGKPVVEAVIDFMERRYKKTEAVVKTAVTKCAKETDPKPCEAVYKFEMCMAEQLGE